METIVKMRKASDPITLSPFAAFIFKNWPKHRRTGMALIKSTEEGLEFTPIEFK